MRRLTGFILLFLAMTLPSIGQNGISNLSYTIDVALDTSDHSLKASQLVKFSNALAKNLTVVKFHLWANAYKTSYSPLVQQQLRMNNTALHFAHPLNKGGYKRIRFTDNRTGQELNIRYLDDVNEIAEIHLSKSLRPQEEMEILIEYEVKIPRLYSRFGRRWDYYQITQWYPKLAKLENEKWHTMPYLDIGEFYSDFADYTVKIKTPENYLIAATGKEQPGNVFTAKNVIDFAWFCSPQFHKETKSVSINDKPIDLEVYSYKKGDAYKNAMSYLERSLQFYSDEVGPYPYEKMTLVLSEYAKGGMEYPNITVIGAQQEEVLDHLIAHEVGHNWFYASLASDERNHAWMDEGLNTFYDHKYHLHYYSDAPYNNLVPKLFQNTDAVGVLEAGFRAQERMGKHQASSLTSESFSAINYGIAAYQKPAIGYSFLESYLGELRFKQMVQTYFSKYKNSNVQPEQLRLTFENESDKNLDWFFDDFIGTEQHIDYAVQSIEMTGDDCSVLIENESTIQAPVHISLMEDDKPNYSFWVDGFEGKKRFELPHCNFDKIELYHQIKSPDINAHNDVLKRGGIFKRAKPLNVKFLGGIESNSKRDLFYLPYFAFNDYDKLMLGMGLYNSSYPPKSFRYALAPAYSVNANELVGFGRIEKDISLDQTSIRKGIASLAFKRYNYFDNQYHLHYTKFTPAFKIYFKTDPLEETSKDLTLRLINLIEEYPIFEEENVRFDETYSFISELKYTALGQDVLAPTTFSISMEYGNYDGFAGRREQYLKVSGEYDYAYQFARSKFFKFRLFGGYFLMNSQRESSSFASRFVKGSFALMSQGFTDYKYDEVYFGRSAQEGSSARQISLNDGGFKDTPGSAFRIGLSNDFIMALNVKTDFPFPIKIPLKLYFDLGAVSTKASASEDLSAKPFYSGGIAFEMPNEMMGIYLPLVQSTDLSNTYIGRSLFPRISFMINFNQANLWQKIEEISL